MVASWLLMFDARVCLMEVFKYCPATGYYKSNYIYYEHSCASFVLFKIQQTKFLLYLMWYTIMSTIYLT